MMTPQHRLARAVIGGALTLAGMAANASLVSSIPLDVAASTVTFSPYAAITVAGPVAASVDVGTAENLESVWLSFNDPDPDRILGNVATSLGNNGHWPADGAFAGLNTNTGTMVFAFGRAMNFVGGYVNYAPDAFDGNPTIAALNAQGDVLEDTALTFNFGDPDGIGLGQFIGFSHADADIWGFALTNGRIAIDNLSFGTNAVVGVPEPAALTLVLAGLAALGWQRRRRA